MRQAADILTIEEAADHLRVSSKTVLALTMSGRLPGTEVGRAWRLLRTDLLGYVCGCHGRPGAVA